MNCIGSEGMKYLGDALRQNTVRLDLYSSSYASFHAGIDEIEP